MVLNYFIRNIFHTICYNFSIKKHKLLLDGDKYAQIEWKKSNENCTQYVIYK